MQVHIDFETRSRVDLAQRGLYNYAADDSTDVICMGYSVDGGPVELWRPGCDIPWEFYSADTFHAWNAEFERLIYHFIMTREYGFPLIALPKWCCTAYQARCSNMPAALGNAARCLRVPHQKHLDGKMLIKMLCQPQPSGNFCTDMQLLARMYEYCKQDVRTEVAVAAQLRELTKMELDDYLIQCRINDRGVLIDTELCAAAQRYATAEEQELVGRIAELTDDAVTKARGEGLKDWVVERLTAEQRVRVANRDGKVSLDRYNRARLLDDDTLDPVVREVVEASDFAQRSSVGKFKAMLNLAGEDDRLRGAILVNGAPESGRYSSKGAQIHNFPRNTLPNPEEARADLVDGIMLEDITDYFKMPMMTLLSRLLRSVLIPAPGHKFLVSDWSAIEGRVAPWLCRDEDKLELYRTGAPIYELAASTTFGVPVDEVTPEQRQIGKVQELSFQYQGGKAAFLAMARAYGVKATAEEADRYKDAWRTANPWAPLMWADIETAARRALATPKELFPVGRLVYFSSRGILAGGTTLFCLLPCGRVLTYPDVRKSHQDGPYGVQEVLTALRPGYTPKASEKDWPRVSLYGGKLFNNAVQGAAASLLRHALRECFYAGLSVVLHLHDEICVESAKDEDKDMLSLIMNTPPDWAKGLPLAAEVVELERYGNH